jgi:hypothetical protein
MAETSVSQSGRQRLKIFENVVLRKISGPESKEVT